MTELAPPAPVGGALAVMVTGEVPLIVTSVVVADRVDVKTLVPLVLVIVTIAGIGTRTSMVPVVPGTAVLRVVVVGAVTAAVVIVVVTYTGVGSTTSIVPVTVLNGSALLRVVV